MSLSDKRGDTQKGSVHARSLALLWVLLAVALATLPKLGNEFVWDDLALIVKSDFIYHWANLPSVFAFDTMFAADGGSFQAIAGLDTYRPITIATFFVDAALSGRRPLAYHLDNFFVHLLCVSLVYALARRLLSEQHRHAASWAAAWFGLHPLLGEAHVWINGRSDLWCTLFGLSGCLLWLDARKQADAHRRAWLLASSGLLFTLGLLSKESLLPALLVLVLWGSGLFQRRVSELDLSRAAGLRSLPVLLAITAYLAMRMTALSGLHVSAGSPQLTLALQRLPVLLLDGFLSSLLPRELMPRYLYESYGRLSELVLWTCAVLVVALGLLAWFGRRRWPLGAFALAWFVAVLAPASLISTLQWYGFGRYLYLPLALLSIGLADALAHGLDWVRAKARPRVVQLCQLGALSYVALLGFRLLESTRYWDGPAAFYTQIIAEQSQASHGHGGLGKWLVEQDRPDLGIAPLERAVELNASDSRYLNNLGIAYLRAGRVSEARAVAKRGQQKFPHEIKFEKLEKLASGFTR